jgi:hypothetical protein
MLKQNSKDVECDNVLSRQALLGLYYVYHIGIENRLRNRVNVRFLLLLLNRLQWDIQAVLHILRVVLSVDRDVVILSRDVLRLCRSLIFALVFKILFHF